MFQSTEFFFRRDPNGKLHLVQDIGKIPLVSSKLIEDPNDNQADEDGKRARAFCVEIAFSLAASIREVKQV